MSLGTRLTVAVAVSFAAGCRRSPLRAPDPPTATTARASVASPAWSSLAHGATPEADVPRSVSARASASGAPLGDPSARSPVIRCARDDAFPSPWLVPEASAAAEVQLVPGTPEILVISDSGRRGAAMAWRHGASPRPLVLPLDTVASDDLEGMAWFADGSGPHLYTMTSSGAVRRFAPDGSGSLRRDDDVYRIGAPPLSCSDLRAVNCGKNWEGLCLRGPRGEGPCAGYAASKAETALYCVGRDERGRLSIDPRRAPRVLALEGLFGHRDVLSDCAFGAVGGPAEDLLFVTTNVYGGSTTYVVDEATGLATPLDLVTTPSNEAIAVDSHGAFYAFMDDNGETSIAARFECTGWSSAAVRR